ncbi:hypothetical protein B0H12DRAFT_1330165 [Mycena haematopus]|nr:hypothetical protein B0H12DRAFT_1330165 [Mycena haematopus]
MSVLGVPELRVRIMELDTEIDLQMELLKKLQHDKSLVQRQLNAVLDPIARLPLEISSEIFLQSLSPFPFLGSADPPTLLLNICHAWSTIALSTPDLWSAIQIEFPCNDSENLAQLLPIWFHRARNRLLSVSLYGDLSSCNHSLSEVIWRYGTQFKRLEISDYDNGDDDREIPFFSSTTAELLLLQHLEIRSSGRGYFTGEILRLLRLAPNLVECVLEINCPLHDSDLNVKLVLASLRRLTFGKRNESWHDDVFLQHLSLPALKVLSLPMQTISGSHLLRFLERSAPPLQELAMDWEYQAFTSINLHECLHLIPSLARFEMWRPDALIVADLFVILVDSPSLLPNLHHLTIHMRWNSTGISDPSWRTLLRAVSTRRIQFHVVGDCIEEPPADVLAALRELVDDRVEIHIIGQGRHDFIQS